MYRDSSVFLNEMDKLHRAKDNFYELKWKEGSLIIFPQFGGGKENPQILLLLKLSGFK